MMDAGPQLEPTGHSMYLMLLSGTLTLSPLNSLLLGCMIKHLQPARIHNSSPETQLHKYLVYQKTEYFRKIIILWGHK